MQYISALTSSQWWAANRHLINSACSMAFGALALLIYQSYTLDKDPTAALNNLATSFGKLALTIVALTTLLGPISTLLKAVQSSSPEKQIGNVAAMANDPSQPATYEAKTALLQATASMPEVTKVIAPTIADDVPSAKVVTK